MRVPMSASALLVVIALLAVCSVTHVSADYYKDKDGTAIAIETQGLPFQAGSWACPWSARFGHTFACTTANSLIVVGGATLNTNGTIAFGSTTRDVWKASDLTGSAFTVVTSGSSELDRLYHSTTTTTDGIVMIGGMSQSGALLSDCRFSTDGRTWAQQSNMPWTTPRFGHSVAYDLSNTRLYVTGGVGAASLNAALVSYNDVWISTNDGSSWSQNTQITDFGRRAFHMSTVVSSTLILMGGLRRNVANASWDVLSDIWYSNDGATFTQISSDIPFAPRFLAQLVTFNNQEVYLIGGFTVPQASLALDESARVTRVSFDPRRPFLYGSYVSEVWLTIDLGTTWTPMQHQSIWSARGALAAALCSGNLFIGGGIGGTNITSDTFWTIVPVNQSGTDAAVVAGVLGSTCGLLILLVMFRKFQAQFDPAFVASAALHAETKEENEKL